MLFQPSPEASTIISWDDLRCTFDALYGPGLKPRGTRSKVRQAINQLSLHAPSPGDVNERTIAAYVTATLARGLEPETTNSVLSAMKGVCKYLVAKEIIRANPFHMGVSFGRKAKSARQRKNKHHSLDDMRRVLAQVDKEFAGARGMLQRWKAGRLRALVWLVAHTGLRCNEALCLRRCRWDGQVIEVRHEDQIDGWLKTDGSEGDVPVPDDAATRINEWIDVAPGYERLFPCVSGDRPWINGTGTYRATGQVAAAGRRAGVAGVTLLSLRHTWQTHARSAWGFNPGEVQLIVRHSTVSTQDHYVHEDRDNLVAMMRRVKY